MTDAIYAAIELLYASMLLAAAAIAAFAVVVLVTNEVRLFRRRRPR